MNSYKTLTRTLTKILTKTSLIFLGCLWVSGCSTKLRAPFCEEGELQWPDQIVGTYLFSMPSSNEESGGAESFEDVYIKIDSNKTLWIDRKNAPIIEKNIAFETACTKDGSYYYSQNLNADGTYSLSKIEASDHYFSLDPLGFRVETLDELGILYEYIPVMEFSDGSWTYNFAKSTELIVDNRNVDPNKLMKASRVGFGNMKFVKVADPDQENSYHKGRKLDWVQVSLKSF